MGSIYVGVNLHPFRGKSGFTSEWNIFMANGTSQCARQAAKIQGSMDRAGQGHIIHLNERERARGREVLLSPAPRRHLHHTEIALALAVM